MEFNNLLRRANLQSIETFIKSGGEDLRDVSTKTYSCQIKEAYENVTQCLKKYYVNEDEFNEILESIEIQACILEDVYFEMGLITGANIAFQISRRLEELN